MDISNLISLTVNIIEENLKEIISISEVSNKLGVSLNYLNRNFKKIIGYTPLDYLKMRKITQGIKQGIKGRRNIIDIAFEYGFNSHEVLIRSCNRYFNKSPREILKIIDWQGCKRLDDKTLWFYLNSDKIIKKMVKLPKVVLKKSIRDDFTVYLNEESFKGEKSDLTWDAKECYKLIPEGVYKSFVISYNISKIDFLVYLKSYYSNSIIIEVKKSVGAIYYIKN